VYIVRIRSFSCLCLAKPVMSIPCAPQVRQRLLQRPLRGLFSPLLPCSCRSIRHNSSSPAQTSSPLAPQTIFSGIQPTGIPHLGNYLGALHNWVKLQNEALPGTKLLYSVVDLHAITIPQEKGDLKRWKRESLAALLAVGLKEEKSVLFFQSDVSPSALGV
jgi:tryptophanyl-tRNA synthetase